jgi:uncharacterized protein
VNPVRFIDRNAAAEWPDSLSAADFQLADWQPMPIREFILKVHNRCNLACDYCYIYEMADTSWSEQEPAMSPAVAKQAALRIREHAQRHELKTVSLVLHGGEPLLIGEKRLRILLQIFSDVFDGVVIPQFGMQTNGLLLTDSMLALLDEYDVHIGVSLDGGREANDKHRTRRNGTGTYAVVAERIHVLQSGLHSPLFRGILATVDITNHPLQVYEDLCRFDPPSIDFLLPHGNWTSPPPLLDPQSDETPYADWLIAIFDEWFSATGSVPRIRTFTQIIRGVYGQPSRSESIGLLPVSLATIQTDGSYELVDTLKSAFNGAAATGLNVFDHDLDTLIVQPSVAARQIGEYALSDTCQQCPVKTICGAGYYPHRYHQGQGFLNPSVFCKDLYKLINHIQDAVVASEG